MLPILPPPLRRPPGRPIKVRRKEPDEPQTTERLSKRGVEMRLKGIKLVLDPATGYPKSARGYPNSTRCPNSVTYCPNSSRSCPKTKLPLKRKSTTTTVRWMPSTQESSMTDH
ncbi:hypothetical protein GOBAR_AA09016 [Gossypium barbadense]|uniref:Uncharacterized protein n=1 Tax=Gossypium barbadense TaxID=3634 RepID=A0A2P5Y7R4_GOSBA|nr:hypothetical protein GOBAR_AA09016 [Gossypium barbadense]